MNAQDRRMFAAMFQLLMSAMFCLIMPDEAYLRETLRSNYATFNQDRLPGWVAGQEQESGE